MGARVVADAGPSITGVTSLKFGLVPVHQLVCLTYNYTDAGNIQTVYFVASIFFVLG